MLPPVVEAFVTLWHLLLTGKTEIEGSLGLHIAPRKAEATRPNDSRRRPLRPPPPHVVQEGRQARGRQHVIRVLQQKQVKCVLLTTGLQVYKQTIHCIVRFN